MPNDASTLDLGLSIGDFAGGAGAFRRKHTLLKRQPTRGSGPDGCLDLTGWSLCVPGWPAGEEEQNCSLASLLVPPGFARVRDGCAVSFPSGLDNLECGPHTLVECALGGGIGNFPPREK